MQIRNLNLRNFVLKYFRTLTQKSEAQISTLIASKLDEIANCTFSPKINSRSKFGRKQSYEKENINSQSNLECYYSNPDTINANIKQLNVQKKQKLEEKRKQIEIEKL